MQDPEEFSQPIRVEDVLDLHGFFPEQVAEVLEEYLRYAVEKQFSEVRIVHGKGRSRLKWETRKILQKHPLVAEFFDAPAERGGWGATIVRIKL